MKGPVMNGVSGMGAKTKPSRSMLMASLPTKYLVEDTKDLSL